MPTHDSAINANLQNQALRGIRVILGCEAVSRHSELRECVLQDPDLCLVGEAMDTEMLATLIEEFIPELVFAGPDLVPSAMEMQLGRFPLFVSVTDSFSPRSNERTIAILDRESSTDQINGILEMVKSRVLQAKWDEILYMLNTVRNSAFEAEYLSEIEVGTEEARLRIPLKQVRCITAAKNYARLNTDLGEFTTRAAMSDLIRRLDPADFLQIHRSVIVNLRLVSSFVERNGAIIAVALRGGATLPVGRTFRQSVSALPLAATHAPTSD